MPPALNSHDPRLTDSTGEDETDAGPGAAPRRGGRKVARTGAPGREERRCIVAMQVRPTVGMIRFVLSPEGEVTPDLAARLPGRGAWITANRAAIETAQQKGAFARAFKAPAKAPADLAGRVETLLERRCLDMLGLGKRAGDLILGFEQVRDWVRNARPACLVEASDGAEDGRDKLNALSRAIHGQDGPKPPVVGCFSADELAMALGRGRVIHACVKQGRFAQSWMGELSRLAGFRSVWLGEVRGEAEAAEAKAGLPSPGGSPDGDTRRERKVEETEARALGTIPGIAASQPTDETEAD